MEEWRIDHLAKDLMDQISVMFSSLKNHLWPFSLLFFEVCFSQVIHPDIGSQFSGSRSFLVERVAAEGIALRWISWKLAKVFGKSRGLHRMISNAYKLDECCIFTRLTIPILYTHGICVNWSRKTLKFVWLRRMPFNVWTIFFGGKNMQLVGKWIRLLSIIGVQVISPRLTDRLSSIV